MSTADYTESKGNKQGNLFKVAYVGASFTALFTAYIAAQNLVAQIYTEYNYVGLGTACVMMIYCFQGTGSIFASHVKRSLTHRKGLVFGALGYASFVVIGAFTTSCTHFNMDFFLCQEGSIYGLNIFTCVFVGLGASIIWLTQSDYVNQCADESTKGLFNSVFWSLMQMSQIFASVLATFVLGSTDPFTFYMILLVFGAIAVTMFAFTPRIESTGSVVAEAPRETLRESIAKFWDAFVYKKSRFMLVPMFLIGIVIAFYAGFLSKIVDSVFDGEDSDFINKRLGFVLIALACGEVSAGFSIGRIADRVDKFKLLHAVIVIPEVALLVSILAFLTNNYALVIVSGYLWGFSDTAINSMLTTIIGAYFGGQLEYFCIMRCLTGYGAVFGAGIALLPIPIVVYGAIIFGGMLALHATFVYNYPKNFKASVLEESKEGLIA